ncbi:Rho GTPase activation protein (RhoGAP) with PH domain [Abeliophyllum distichum]|uniref:Rho GTPase activation protein (RhoGAP) with PH domain n=1 Tax=Abeliophyllum distichum TaxID=126358 RepID=A0ABD1Q715_9LAMI
MTNRNVDSCLGEGGGNVPSPPSGQPGPTVHGGNKVYKSGPLFLSSKGIGWTSWKKRWFILTRTSLVFFRSDPSAVPQKGSEVNLTLGGIDLNSSGSVVVKEDKKLLTVLFPDGRDGRAFTLKAETLEDLQEWKAALEEALSNAPSAALVMGQNGIFRNDQSNAADASSEQVKDRQPVKSLVIGRPILLALEDIDGTPSFLEKALRFVEAHGVKVEGILRQAADVDDVERRIRDYEQGKSEFSPEEDPHVIADCVKYVIRELPSSPVPASCCNALLEACRTDRGMRVNAMRTAICETFPEPNRRLLQRILMMMQTIASHKAENRMSTSAVAACMAPLLLRPLLAGDCELENVFDMGGDGSVQLLQAAAAANHAQAICITLLEEYDNIFGEGSASPEPYTDSEETGSESEEITDDDDDDDDSFEDDEDDAADGSEVDIKENSAHDLSETSSETSEIEDNKKVSGGYTSDSRSPEVDDVLKDNTVLPSNPIQTSLPQHDSMEGRDSVPNQSNVDSKIQANDELIGIDPAETSIAQRSIKSSNGPTRSAQRPTVWGRTPAKKNLSMESIDLPIDDEDEIQKLESTKADLQNRIAKEAKANSLLKDDLEMRKNALHERRLALEKDVARLQDQLQKERELRAALEAGLRISQVPLSIPSTMDEKTKAELEEIAQVETDVSNLNQKANDLQVQLNQQQEQNSRFQHDTDNQLLQSPNRKKKTKDKYIDVGDISISSTPEKSARSKDTYLDKASSDQDKKIDSPSSTNKHLPPNKQTDVARNSKITSVMTTSSVDMGISRSATTSSKKSGTKSEAANHTTSTLAKLTNRLNFLKEKRTQIANELQNLDKSRNSGHSIHNFEQGEGSELHHSVPNADNIQGSEGQSSERHRGTGSSHNQDSQLVQSANKARNTEGHPNLDRGKSESFPTVDKGRSTIVPPRTYSR